MKVTLDMPRRLRSFFPNSRIWIQGSGAIGYVAKGICFSKIFEGHLTKFKMDPQLEFFDST